MSKPVVSVSFGDQSMSFTDQKQRVATEEDLRAAWSGIKNGKRFYCRLCGHQFQVGDKWRWVYGGSVHRVNLVVCEECDGLDVLEKWENWWKEWETLAQTKFRYIADMLEDVEKGVSIVSRGELKGGSLDG